MEFTLEDYRMALDFISACSFTRFADIAKDISDDSGRPLFVVEYTKMFKRDSEDGNELKETVEHKYSYGIKESDPIYAYIGMATLANIDYTMPWHKLIVDSVNKLLNDKGLNLDGLVIVKTKDLA